MDLYVYLVSDSDKNDRDGLQRPGYNGGMRNKVMLFVLC